MSDQPLAVTTTTATDAPAAGPTTTEPPVAGSETATEPAKVVPDAEPAKVEEPKKPDADSRAFAAIAKEKRELRAEREAFKKDVAEVKALKEALASGDPMEIARAMGKSETDVLNSIISKGKPETEASRLERLEKALAERDARDKETAEKRAAEEKAGEQKRSYAEDIQFVKDRASADKDKYPLVMKRGDSGADLVRETYLAITERDGDPPAIQDVLNYVENFYRKEAEDLATTLGWSKPVPAAAATTPAKTNGDVSLSHRTTSSPMTVGADKYPIDPEERTRALNRERGWT